MDIKNRLQQSRRAHRNLPNHFPRNFILVAVRGNSFAALNPDLQMASSSSTRQAQSPALHVARIRHVSIE